MTIEEFGQWLSERHADNLRIYEGATCCESCHDRAEARADESEDVLSKFQKVKLGKSES